MTYHVKPSDTLAAIGLRFYGDPRYWFRIAQANRLRDPRLTAGQRLRLP